MSTNAAAVIVPTDISAMVREIEIAYNRYLTEFRIPDDHKIVVNFSAGKIAPPPWRLLMRCLATERKV
ncbi:Uncharacterised protein [Citrobacter koseri]|nr:hypothetical protein [Citrobacter koseri]STB73843.1 Uncharacterised protein [Citrobacter koseri]